VNFDRVADQVDHDLTQAGGVTNQRVGDVGSDPRGQFQPFEVGAVSQRAQHLAQRVAQQKLMRVKFQLPASIFEKSEISLMMCSQLIARRLDHLQVLALLRSQIGVEELVMRMPFMGGISCECWPEIRLADWPPRQILRCRALARTHHVVISREMAKRSDDMPLKIAQRHLGRRDPRD